MLYERSLKRHLRGNLMSNKKYATKGYTDSDIIETMTFPAAYEYLYKFTVEKSYFDPNKLMIDQFFEQPPDMSSRKDESAKRCYSLEILFNTAVHQIRNDISILEACCPQGYVYTHQLSEKYSKALGHTRMPFLDRLMLAALNYFAQTDVFTNMKAFAFYHKYDAKAMEMLTTALKPQRHVKVMRFDDLFPMPTYEYRAPPGCEGALLVLHADCSPFHNFDAHPKGTCAAALAAASSAAASLHRNREDLLSFIM